MKTHLIQLEPYDDVISVRDKMSWTKTPRILLISLHQSRTCLRSLDLRILQRHANTLGAQMALVTRSPEMRQMASALGISVFAASNDAQRSSWNMSSYRTETNRRMNYKAIDRSKQKKSKVTASWQTHPMIRLIIFILAVFAILVLLILFMPSAEIKLTPKTEVQRLTIPVSANANAMSVNVTGVVPAHIMTTEVEGVMSKSVTGQTVVPDQFAEGVVRFRNLTTDVVGIPAGTIVSTTDDESIRFETISDGVVEAGVGKTVDVVIRALKPGIESNLPSNSVLAIEGNLGTRLTVTNPNSTTGGSNQTTSMPTEVDQANLRETLIADLQKKALEQMKQNLADGDILFPDTLSVYQVLQEDYFPREGQPSDALTISLKYEYQARYSTKEDLENLGWAVLDTSILEGYSPIIGTLVMKNVSTPTTDSDSTTHWTIKLERTTHLYFDKLYMITLVQGKLRTHAIQELEELFSFSSPPRIIIRPSWWPWLPLIQFRITINYD